MYTMSTIGLNAALSLATANVESCACELPDFGCYDTNGDSVVDVQDLLCVIEGYEDETACRMEMSPVTV